MFVCWENSGDREKEHWVNTGSPAPNRRHMGSSTVWDPNRTMWESCHLLSMLSVTKGRKLHWNVKLLPWFTFSERRTGGVGSGLAVTCEALGTGWYFKQTNVPGCTVRFLHVACCLFQQILENLLQRALASARHIDTPTPTFGVCSAAHSTPLVRALSSA